MSEAILSPNACDPPFWEHPRILFDSFTLYYESRCSHSVWNFVARIVLLSLFIGMVGSLVAGLAFIPVATLFGTLTALALVMITPVPSGTSAAYEEVPIRKLVDPSGYLSSAGHRPQAPEGASPSPSPSAYLAPMKERFEAGTYATSPSPSPSIPVKEAFVNGGGVKGAIQPVEDPVGRDEIDAAPYSGPALPDHTPPTSRNPFMNILLDEYKYHPDRPPAAPVSHPDVEQVMDDYFRIQWHSDPTDVYGKKQSQRQFITQPSTSIPNDQGAFADWLYRIPGKTCKEGGRRACLTQTENGHIPWMSQM
jgi:hypothetical protein